MNIRFKRYLQYIGKSDQQRYLERAGLIPPELKRQLYSFDVQRELYKVNPYSQAEEYLNRQQNPPFLSKLLYLDLKTYLPYDILAKVHIASMINSLEVRVPFLDHELVEFAASVPANMKIKNRSSKHILKHSVSNLLPQEVLTRKNKASPFHLSIGLEKN